jgi:hypothetical protein
VIHGYISLSGLISFLIVQSFANSDHPNGHPERAFFKNPKILGLGRQIGLKFLRHLEYFQPNYWHYFGTVSPLSMKKCIWSFSYKKLWLSGLKYITPKYDIDHKEFGKEPSHFRHSMLRQILIKSQKSDQRHPQHQTSYLRGPESS